MSRVHRPRSLFIFRHLILVVTCLMAGIALVSCSRSKDTTPLHLSEVERTLKQIQNDLSILGRNVPEATYQKLQKLEGQLNDRKQWPFTAAEAEKMRQALDDIVGTIPPLATERIADQLASLSWAVEAMWDLRSYSTPAPEQLGDVVAAISELLERPPFEQFNELRTELEGQLQTLRSQERDFRRDQLRERAKSALDGKEDAAEVYSGLEAYRGETDIDQTLHDLRRRIVEDAAHNQLVTMEDRLQRADALNDDRLRQIALLTVNEAVSQLLVELELSGDAPPRIRESAKSLDQRCREQLYKLTDAQQASHVKKVKNYQRWALEQILLLDGDKGWFYDRIHPWFKQELNAFMYAKDDKKWVPLEMFPSIKDLLREKAGVDLSDVQGGVLTAAKMKEIYDKGSGIGGANSEIISELAYRTTRDGMVKFLLPIQVQLLDPPVAQLYQQVFSKSWQKLEGREDQLYVAQQSAIVSKMTLENCPSFNPEPNK